MKLYPIIVKIDVQVTSDDDVTSGTATYQFPLNKLPTEEDMPKIFDEISSQLPDSFRLMTRHESLMHFLRHEKHYTGPIISPPALSDGEEWHDPATANTEIFDEDEIGEDEA